jgi:hypothetical protein
MARQINNMENKTTWMKIKDSLPMALTSAVIVIVLILVVFSLFKLVPAFITNGSSYFASALNSIFVPNQKIEEEAPVVVATTTVTKTVVQKTTTQYYGKSDLAIRLIGTGVIDKTTNQFYQTNYSGFNDTAGIKFEIVNIGTNVSGTFMVRLNLPSRTLPYYDSVRQISLRPGDKIEYVASFDNPINLGVNTAYITADPLNEIDESSENNNALVVPVKIDNSSYSYNNYNYATAYNPNPVLPYGTLYTWVNMQGSCYANINSTYQGNTVTWHATATGGNGYFSYSWTGTDGLTSNMNTVDKTYYYSGPKTARVTITSQGQSITKECTMYVY